MTPERFALNMIKVVDCSGLGPHSQSTFAQNNKTCGENGEQKNINENNNWIYFENVKISKLYINNVK